MPSADMMSAIAEPFFEMGARVEVQPVMNFEDLKKGLSAAIKQKNSLFFHHQIPSLILLGK